MKLYIYNDKKVVIHVIDVKSRQFREHFMEAIYEGNLREVVAESLFVDGYREESAKVSFVLAALDGQKKSPTS